MNSPEVHYTPANSKYEIVINYSRDKLLTENSISALKNRYLLPTEKSPQEGFARAACAFASNKEHAQRLYSYVSKLWFMFATPLLSNGGTDKGLPISCFLSDTNDSIEDLGNKLLENVYLSVYGGGIGTNFSKVRSRGTSVRRGGETPGIIPFIKCIDSQMAAYHQGLSRRGSAAVYLDISHPEIEEFIEIRDPMGGDVGRRCLGIGFHHAVNIPDSFMAAVSNADKWELVDPHTKQVKKTVDARKLWDKILEMRMTTGEPYLHFIDESNRQLNKALFDQGMRVNCSNLCSEITLPTSEEYTAVCCLSSLNIEKYDEWSPVAKLFISDVLEMLDNALEVFIKEAPEQMWRAVRSAKSERSVGLGAMGLHSYLQSKDISIESEEAAEVNKKIFADIREVANWVSKKLGKERGEPELLRGTGDRFAHKLAIAPNASSSVICGNTSPSIEPHNSNFYVQDSVSGSSFVKNKFLEAKLEKLGLNTKEMWTRIILAGGSVQGIDEIPDEVKEVFKTAFEIDQEALVRLAGDRQKYICQAQSLNVFIEPNEKMSTIRRIHKLAWQVGLKSMYYLRTKTSSRATKK